MSNPITELGGEIISYLRWGEINPYFTQVTLALFVIAVIFTFFTLVKPEKQVQPIFGADQNFKRGITDKNLRIRRYMAVVCGIATAWGVITGDFYNYILSISLIGITNIGIVAASKGRHVLNAAFQYGLMIMLSSIPLFGSAGILLGSTGTLSIHELTYISVRGIAPMLFLIGVAGEIGIAPVYATKAELFRSPGAPYIIMIHVSSLLILVRTVEIALILTGG